MIPTDFHFERPLWLLALVPVAVVLWYAARSSLQGSAWRSAVDAHLLQHLALPGESGRERWPLWLLGAGWLAACIAMAGPSWERVPQPTTKTIEPTVVALDMSVSMDAEDLTPSRLARARYKLQDVLERNAGGQVGLVIYSDEPFVASPLTDDGRVIAEMIPTLTSDIMPGRGSRPDRAIEQAAALLEQAGVPGGRIVLFADSAGDHPEATHAAAARAAADGRTVSVLAIGTAEGAPIPDGRGGYARRADGSVFDASVPMDAMRSLAGSGGGRFAEVAAGSSDLDVLLAEPLSLGQSDAGGVLPSGDVEIWKDAGAYLVLLPVLLAPLAFRRGWLAAVALGLMLAAPPPASASVWDDLWQTRDQQGADAFAAGDAARATELFESDDWRAAAYYESGDFETATEHFASLDGTENRYNLGNALAKSGQLEEAIAAYDEVLDTAPDHEDARFNRDLAEQLLEQQREQEQRQNEQQSQGDEGDESEPSASQSSQSGESGNEDQSDSADSSSEQGEAGESADADRQNAQEQADTESGSDADSEAEQAQAPSASPEETDGEDDSSRTAQSAPGASDDEPSEEPYANRPEPETGSNSVQEEMDRALEEAQADESAEEGGAQVASPGYEPLTEEQQAREQMLRQVPDDPAGLLRAKIARTYAAKRFAEQRSRIVSQGGTNPWW